MGGEPRLDHLRAELRAQVDREVRESEAVGERARAANRLRRAAAALAVVLGVGPQLERHGDRTRAGQHRSEGAVDAAAHRDERPAPPGGERRLRARRLAERPVQGVRGKLGRVALRRDQTAQRSRDLVGADARRIEQLAALRERRSGASGGDRAAAAVRVEPRGDDALAVEGHRHPHDVAAGRAAGRAGACARRHEAAPVRTLEMLAQRHGTSIARGAEIRPARVRSYREALSR